MNAWGVYWGDSWGTSWGPLHEIHESWDTSQGQSPIRFEPVRGVEVVVQGAGCTAHTSPVCVESARTTVVTPVGASACARAGCVTVETSCSVRVSGVGARAGSRVAHVEASSVFVVRGYGSRGGSGRVVGSGSADVCPGSYFAGARSVAVLPVLAVKNPTDEELLHLFLRNRRFTS